MVKIRYDLRYAERSGTISPHCVLRSRFWQLAQDEFRQLGMDGHLIRLLDVDQGVLIDAGPVDAGLLELARAGGRRKRGNMASGGSSLGTAPLRPRRLPSS